MKRQLVKEHGEKKHGAKYETLFEVGQLEFANTQSPIVSNTVTPKISQ